MNRRIALLAAALLAVASPARAGIDQAGTTSASFLSVGSGASVLGMGGATLGSAGDLNAASWNPGALGVLNETQMTFSHAGLAAQTAQEWAAVGGRFGSRTRWSMSGLYQGDGSIEGRDAFNNPIGTLSASSMAFGFHAAQPISPNVSVGLGFKYVAELLAGVSGAGLGFDAGVLVRTGALGFGLAAQNLGGKVNYDGGSSYSMPQNIGAGASFTDESHGLRFGLDLNFPNAYYNDLRTGVEWMYHDRFALRTGYRMELGADNGEPLSGPTFGMGTGVNGFWFDYGYVVGGGGESQHRIGLTFRPGMMNFGATTDAAHDEPVKAEKAPKTEKPKKEKAPKAEKTASVAKPTAPAAATGAAAATAATATTVDDLYTPAPKKSKKGAEPAPAAAKSSGAPANTAPKSGGSAASAAAPPIVAAPIVAAPVVAAPKPTAAAASPKPAAEAAKTTPAPASTAAKSPESQPTGVTNTTPKPAATTTAPSSSAVAADVAPAAPKPAAAAAVVAAPVAVSQSAKPPVDAPKPEVAKTEAPKPAPETVKPVETQAAPTSPTPSAEPAKPAPAPIEAPKPAEAAAATATVSAAETPKPAPVVKAEPAKSEPAKAAMPPRPPYVTLKKGQTLDDVARLWGISVSAIMMENNLVTQKTVKPGTKIKLPPQR